MAELADAMDLDSITEKCAGSTPVKGINYKMALSTKWQSLKIFNLAIRVRFSVRLLKVQTLENQCYCNSVCSSAWQNASFGMKRTVVQIHSRRFYHESTDIGKTNIIVTNPATQT